METTKITEAEYTTYSLAVEGVKVSELTITTGARIVTNVETLPAHRGLGYARHLWETANRDGEVLHALEHHRTAEGEAFARAMGGETADEADDYEPTCCICTDN